MIKQITKNHMARMGFKPMPCTTFLINVERVIQVIYDLTLQFTVCSCAFCKEVKWILVKLNSLFKEMTFFPFEKKNKSVATMFEHLVFFQSGKNAERSSLSILYNFTRLS